MSGGSIFLCDMRSMLTGALPLPVGNSPPSHEIMTASHGSQSGILSRVKIYLDLCALKRPYDAPIDDRVVVEAMAVASLIRAFEEGALELASSSVPELENSRNPTEDRREEMPRILKELTSREDHT